jgi:asparagine synthase (glutamine-hydrolysing)
MQLVAENKVVVTLDGQGADEALGGYTYFFGFYFKELFRRFKLFTLFSEMFQYLVKHRSLYGLQTFVFFLLPNSVKNRLRLRSRSYVNKEFCRNYAGRNGGISELYASADLKDALYNHFEYKMEHLLKWSDRNSMFFSLETRSPFMDHHLIERSIATSSSLKIRRGELKCILREAVKSILPPAIWKRKDKVGFETPEDKWFREEEVRVFIFKLINSESFRTRAFFDQPQVLSLYEKHLRGEINISKEIWKWINLELWYREFIDSKVQAKEQKKVSFLPRTSR